MPITIIMRQVLPNVWQIESAAGHVIQKGIIACSEREADDYVRKYASSFNNWTYRIALIDSHLSKT